MTDEQRRYLGTILGSKSQKELPNSVAETGKEQKIMKVYLHDKTELEIFRKLIDNERTCPQCGHIQPASQIVPEIQCLNSTLKVGYVEIVCPKCSNVQAILPIYDAFPSCVQEFNTTAKTIGIDPDTDSIESCLGNEMIDKLRESVKRHKGGDKANEADQKYRNLF